VAKNILHMLSSWKHMSPFDLNMALDAGFDSVTSYGSVTLDEITPLVQGRHVFAFPARRGSYMRFLRRK
jgi:hypothetical protein